MCSYFKFCEIILIFDQGFRRCCLKKKLTEQTDVCTPDDRQRPITMATLAFASGELKRVKGIFVYVLEYMLSLYKMQKSSTLICKKFEI